MDKVIVVLGGEDYAKIFKTFGNTETQLLGDVELDYQLLGVADLVVFTGGHDVDPSIYGEALHRTTNPNIQRDMREAKVYKYCVANQIPMAGICRGSQFLTVMNGGKLIQNVSGHAIGQLHDMRYVSKKGTNSTDTELGDIPVTSTHHQMMYPWNLPEEDFKIIGYARHLSDKYEGVPAIESSLRMLSLTAPTMEPEVVWYYKTRCLAVQFHPEMMPPSSDGWMYYQRLIAEYFFSDDEIPFYY